MSRYDHIVIGAGIVGSCAAFELVQKGRKVLLLEQFTLPHTRGSSHGPTRMIRSCYAEAHFAAIMPDAFNLWKGIEKATGKTLIVQTGVLCVNRAGSQTYEDCLKNMERYSPQNLAMTNIEELTEKYPMIRYSGDYAVFMDKSGGVILANTALSAVQGLFKRSGGHLWDSCKVSKIEPGDEVKVSTSKGFAVAPSVVICAGCWTKDIVTPHLIPEIPLQPVAVKVFYWKEKEFGKYTTARGFPALIDCTSEPEEIYSLPSLEYPSLVKVCVHGGVPCDPDERDKVVHNKSLQITAEKYIREHLPGLENSPSIVENCMYTVTPDETSIIDRIPDHKNIVIGSGFSGTGFKTAPVAGKLLAELATGQTPSHDLSAFLLSRFATDVKSQPQLK